MTSTRSVNLTMIITSFFIFLSVSGCLTTHPQPDGYKFRLAVLDFANNGRSHRQGLCDFFADRLTHELYRKERFELVERGEVNATLVLEKIDKPADGLSTEEVKRIGKRLGVDALVLGEVTEYQAGDFETGPSRVGVLVRVVSCKDGCLLAMEKTRVKSKRGDLGSLSERAVAEVAEALMMPLRKAEHRMNADDSLFVPLEMKRSKDR